MFKVLLLSDVHLGNDTNYEYAGGKEYINTFGSRAEGLIKKLVECSVTEDIDLVVNLGDSICSQNENVDKICYAKFISLFKSISSPIVHLIGNHDGVNLDKSQIYSFIGNSKNFFFDQGKYRHIIMNGNWAKNELKISLNYSVECIEKCIDESPNLALIYSHYPVFNQQITSNYYFMGEEDAVYFSERDELRDRLLSSKKVAGIFSGHLHFFNEQINGHIKCITVPSLTENDGCGKPAGSYIIANLDGRNIFIEHKKVTVND